MKNKITTWYGKIKKAHYSEKEHKGEGYGGEGQFQKRRIEERSQEYEAEVRTMRSLCQSQSWTEVERFKQKLRSEGYTQDVIDKWIIAPAMHGLQFKKRKA